MNDQSFDSFLIVGGPKDYIITSTRADPISANTSQGATFTAHVLALSGAVFGLMGFFFTISRSARSYLAKFCGPAHCDHPYGDH